jgi:DNA polymerase III alpha subunit
MSRGIKILPPSLKSGKEWTMTGDKEISMGFSGINGLGDIAYAELISLVSKKKGKDDKNKTLETISMAEFFELPFSKFNKTAFESCVKAGVFDSWSESRAYLNHLKSKKKKKVVPNQIMMFDMGGEEFDLKIDTSEFPKTSLEEKKSGFIEVCNFDLEKIERITNIRTNINKLSKRPIENIVNFEDDNWYFFILEDIKESTAKTGTKYLTLKVGDGIGSTNLRVFSPMADKIRPELAVGCVYISRFEKNQGGFVNFKRGAQFKKLDL